MQCSNPRTVGFKADGKSISWSQKEFCKEFATFQLPCSKCLECRLEYARQWAIRCVHEAKMHSENAFITLTYDNDHLKDPKLNYADFQKFMKRLRFAHPHHTIGVFVTGEYGEQTKRPHWHAILFGWYPRDATYLRSNERGDEIFSSKALDKIWGQGKTETGSVTFESAGYCARYAAKKLVHGNDGHEYEPISKKSSKHAIGKKWLEKYYFTDCFAQGRLILDNGTITSIPRYYEKWFKEKHPDLWLEYLDRVKFKKMEHAQARADQEKEEYWSNEYRRRAIDFWMPPGITPAQRKSLVLKSKFKQLQESLKL